MRGAVRSDVVLVLVEEAHRLGERVAAERIAELAEVLIPIVGGPGPVAARRLQGMARWLLGGR